MDFSAYLASDCSSDGGSDFAMSADEMENGEKIVLKKKSRSRYSALLDEVKGIKSSRRAPKSGRSGPIGVGPESDAGTDSDSEVENMVITFNTGLSDKAKEIVEKKKKKDLVADETVFARKQRLKRERKKEQKTKAAEKSGKGLPAGKLKSSELSYAAKQNLD
eukprot:995129_1